MPARGAVTLCGKLDLEPRFALASLPSAPRLRPRGDG